MAKVIGLGGIFFKASSPKKLARWYSRHLGIDLESPVSATFNSRGMPTGGCTVWSAFRYRPGLRRDVLVLGAMRSLRMHSQSLKALTNKALHLTSAAGKLDAARG
jgi:hypothetical protein